MSMIADMHTHSEYSHDSVCKIEDMYLSQIRKGTEIVAVTDHFDTASFDEYDVFTPIKKAHDTIKELNKRYCNMYPILSGIEISESFWFPETYKKAIDLVDYDVVIGSVHLVRYKDLTMAYSKIDFSRLDGEEIKEYVDAYFDDVLTMIEFADFDILAHLTCPLRYITGKYKIDLDISLYSGKIEKILSVIIEKGIALEVNTSSFEVLGDFMPTISILKKYRNMGGYLLTLGSDAHICEKASSNFREAIEAIRKIGFNYIYYYRGRKPFQIKI